MEREKYVDESWKDSVSQEKELGGSGASQPEVHEAVPEVNFITYLTSLAFQAMIFLGELENPVTKKTERNLPQAKFLIDTLTMLRDKTKGNLTKEEEDLLNSAVYELQLKFVEQVGKSQQ